MMDAFRQPISSSNTEHSGHLRDFNALHFDIDIDEATNLKKGAPSGGFNGRAATQYSGDVIAILKHNSQLQEEVRELTKTLQQVRFQRPCTDFQLFPRLPPELRHKVWRYALPGPRVVNFNYIHHSRHSTPHFEANYRPPALLHVCREAREVALENYELAFKPKGSSRPASYFDLRRDTLCFTRETTPILIALFLEDMPHADVRRVRYLAVGTELPRDVVKYITQFHGLEVFSLILADPRVVTPLGEFSLSEVEHRSLWVMGSYWNHSLTSWGSMEINLRSAFEEEREMYPDCSVPVVEFVYAISADIGCCENCPGHEG